MSGVVGALYCTSLSLACWTKCCTALETTNFKFKLYIYVYSRECRRGAGNIVHSQNKKDRKLHVELNYYAISSLKNLGIDEKWLIQSISSCVMLSDV